MVESYPGNGRGGRGMFSTHALFLSVNDLFIRTITVYEVFHYERQAAWDPTFWRYFLNALSPSGLISLTFSKSAICDVFALRRNIAISWWMAEKAGGHPA